jgi:hypothetical protein
MQNVFLLRCEMIRDYLVITYYTLRRTELRLGTINTEVYDIFTFLPTRPEEYQPIGSLSGLAHLMNLVQ